MSAFTACALAALAVILIVAAVQVAAEDRRDRRRSRTRCSCRRYRLTDTHPTVYGYDVVHAEYACSPKREVI